MLRHFIFLIPFLAVACGDPGHREPIRGGSKKPGRGTKDILEINRSSKPGAPICMNVQITFERLQKLNNIPILFYTSNLELRDTSNIKLKDSTAQAHFLKQKGLELQDVPSAEAEKISLVELLASARHDRDNCSFLKLSRYNFEYRIDNNDNRGGSRITLSGGIKGYDEIVIDVNIAQQSMTIEVRDEDASVNVCGQQLSGMASTRYHLEWNKPNNDEMLVAKDLISLFQEFFGPGKTMEKGKKDFEKVTFNQYVEMKNKIKEKPLGCK